jgi:hypothetical protein
LWKWGAGPEEMLYKDQPKFIKFALENVKTLIGNESPTVSTNKNGRGTSLYRLFSKCKNMILHGKHTTKF